MTRPAWAWIRLGLWWCLTAVTAARGADSVAPSRDALERAAVAGEAEAQYRLGLLYWEGAEGMTPDPVRAVELWTAAARKMHAGAIFALGNAVAAGRGVPRHPGRAAALWRHAADAGHPGAMTALAKAYVAGDGVPADAAEAVRWFQRAAARGDIEAEYCLGWHYETGHGVAADPVQAAICYLNAADAGHAAAQTRLALLYANGIGVPKNEVLAHFWLSRAIAGGDREAPGLLRSLERRMSWRERRRARAIWTEYLQKATPPAAAPASGGAP